MVVRTENIETPKTECHLFHETETLVCLFVVFFRFLLLLFVCLFVHLFVGCCFFSCDLVLSIIWHHRLYFPSSRLITKL